MMVQERFDSIQYEITAMSQNLFISYAEPNVEVIVELMKFDASAVGELTSEKLSQYILTMGQYLVMLQYNENLKSIDHMLAQKAFEYAFDKQYFVSADSLKSVKTEKAKKVMLLQQNSELRDLEFKALEAQAQKMLLDNMTKVCLELLNAFKKEKSSRDSERQYANH